MPRNRQFVFILRKIDTYATILLTNRPISDNLICGRWDMLKYKRRESFASRLEKIDSETKNYFTELEQEFLNYPNV